MSVTVTTVATVTPVPLGPGPWDGYIPLCWALGVLIVMAMFIYSLVMSWIWRTKIQNTEDFVVARGASHLWQIAWSMYCGMCGSWVIATTAAYASAAGIIGLVFYALACGSIIPVVAFGGAAISKALPRVMSLSGFSGWRFGTIPQLCMTLLSMLSMVILVLGEYIIIGTLYKVYLGSIGYPMIILIGLTTLIYTYTGGLRVSLATDRLQGCASVLMTVVIAIYLGVTFDMPLPPADDRVTGNTEIGLSSIFVMPASLFQGVLTDSMFQRAFAAENQKKLRIGGIMGGAMAFFVVFICGLCGWLAAWGDPATVFMANPNLYMFYGLKDSVNPTYGTLNNWMGVFVLLMAVIMATSCVDGLQNGLAAAITSLLSVGARVWNTHRHGKAELDYEFPLWIIRLLVVLANIPLIVLACLGSSKDWAILDLFLISSMLAATIAVPFFCGLIKPFVPFFGGFSFMATWVLTFIFCSLYGIFMDCWQKELVFDPYYFVWGCVADEYGTYDGAAYGAGAGMAYTWYRNGYRWQYFLMAIGCSIGLMFACILINFLLERCGIKTPLIPGFRPLYLNDPQEEEVVKEDKTLDDAEAEGGFGPYSHEQGATALPPDFTYPLYSETPEAFYNTPLNPTPDYSQPEEHGAPALQYPMYPVY